jgi:hypothetical protein
MAKQPTITEFVSSMGKANGFARTSKYAVVITPPASIAGSFEQLNWSVGRQVNLHCNTVSMPGHDLQAQDVQHGSAPGRQVVQSHDYNGTIAASFYLDSHLRERHFFEKWQSMAVNKSTHKAEYYDNYIGTMEIFQLNGAGEITYGIKAIEVYPTTIAGIEYAYANTNQIALQSVNFQYRQWFNMTSDDIAGYTKTSILDWKLDEHQQQKKKEAIDKYLSIDKDATKLKQEQSRQRQLRPPEIDIDRHAANRKAAVRDQRLRPPTASSKVDNMNRDAIAKGLGYESAAALKTDLRNKAKGL